MLPDAPLESAIDSAVFGRMFNSGQSCVATKRIIVVGQERGKAFIDGFTAKVEALKIGDPAEASTELCANAAGGPTLLQRTSPRS